MSQDHINYGETFCDAVDIIVSQKLKELEYDVTKICTITDNVYRNLGRYTVQEETIKYEAYSTNKDFNIGDAVLVTIPNGDYSMQKMILSKVALDEDLTTSIAYSSPLEQMLDFTGNISQERGEYSLLANGGHNEDSNDFSSITLIESISWNANIDDSYSDYTKMGVSVDFRTWLSEWKTTSGSYGLLFYFYDYNSTPEDKSNKNSAYSFIFDTKNMLGNTYNFSSYVTQEILFDISQLKNITQLDIYFYQNGDFKTAEGDLIPNSVVVGENGIEEFKMSSYNDLMEEEIQLLNDNIFIKNLYIQLGYDLNEFSGDELRLSTNDSLEYSSSNTSNNKNLLLKWIHKKEDGKYELMSSIGDNAKLYWVRRGTTAQAIEYIVGQGWGQKNMTLDSTEPFKCILDIDNGLSADVDIDVKVVARFKQSDGNWATYNSNILTFYSIDPRVDETTYDAATKLSIVCVDNSEGNYLLYGQNSKLINEGLGAGYSRELRLKYKNADLDKSEELKDNIQSIIWTLPTNNKSDSFTMINWNFDNINDTSISYSEDGNYAIITLNEPTVFSLKYNISNVWYASNSHNTIQCKVTAKNGVIYESSRTLSFGKANSQGTNFSIVIQYKNGENAYEVQTNNNQIIGERKVHILKGLVYDLSGNLIANNGEWTWEIIGDEFDISKRDEDPSTATIVLKDSVTALNSGNRDYYNIVKVSYKSDKTVTIYFPIAIKVINNNLCASMDGAREIIYNSYGSPSYYTGAYILRKSNGEEISGLRWTINTDDDKQNYPTLTNLDNHKALLAKPIYVKDYAYHTVVTASKSDLIYWIQPILIMQSQYDFAIINAWNGESTLEDGNKIVTGVIAAGKKDATTNAFSGIIIGDLDEKSEDGTTSNIRTGLYGILKGVNTFSLTDSGNAYFHYTEKKDENEISTYIDFGEDNKLGSSYDDGDKDFLIDLDDQFLSISNKKGGELLLSNGSPYLRLKDKNGIILQFTQSSNYLQSSNFSSADGATAGLRINLNTKKITGYNDSIFNWFGSLHINSNNFLLNTAGTTNDIIFKVGELSVKKNGEVYYGSQTLSEYIKQESK